MGRSWRCEVLHQLLRTATLVLSRSPDSPAGCFPVWSVVQNHQSQTQAWNALSGYLFQRWVLGNHRGISLLSLHFCVRSSIPSSEGLTHKWIYNEYQQLIFLNHNWNENFPTFGLLTTSSDSEVPVDVKWLQRPGLWWVPGLMQILLCPPREYTQLHNNSVVKLLAQQQLIS